MGFLIPFRPYRALPCPAFLRVLRAPNGGISLSMAVVKFLQVSDFHLGRPFGWIAPDRRPQRKQDQRRALEMSVQQAIERGVDAILIPGDLFDQECVDADTLAFAVRAFEVSGCPPVFIAPGNHDPYSEVSHYWNPHLLRARA